MLWYKSSIFFFLFFYLGWYSYDLFLFFSLFSLSRVCLAFVSAFASATIMFTIITVLALLILGGPEMVFGFAYYIMAWFSLFWVV